MLETVGGVLGFLVYAYLLYRQNKIMEEQNEIMREQGGAARVLANSRGRFAKYWPMLVMSAMLLLTWGAVGYDIYHRHSSGLPDAFDWNKPLTEVRNQVFVNERVEVDGKDFIDCTFRNVTFVYNGTDRFSMTHDTFSKPVLFSTESDSVSGTAVLFKATGVLGPDFDITNHHRLLNNIQSPNPAGNSH